MRTKEKMSTIFYIDVGDGDIFYPRTWFELFRIVLYYTREGFDLWIGVTRPEEMTDEEWEDFCSNERLSFFDTNDEWAIVKVEWHPATGTLRTLYETFKDYVEEEPKTYKQNYRLSKTLALDTTTAVVTHVDTGVYLFGDSDLKVFIEEVPADVSEYDILEKLGFKPDRFGAPKVIIGMKNASRKLRYLYHKDFDIPRVKYKDLVEALA